MLHGKQRKHCYMHKIFQIVIFTPCHVQEKLSVLAIQSVYDASMPHPCKEAVRGEILPSAWILEPDIVNGREITRVIYMAQVRFFCMSNCECKKLLHSKHLRAGKQQKIQSLCYAP